MRHVLVAVFAQGGVLRNPNEGLCGQIPNIALRAIASSSVVLLGRDTGLPHLLAPNLLTGGKGADLVIRGNVVLNTLSARSTSTLLRD